MHKAVEVKTPKFQFEMTMITVILRDFVEEILSRLPKSL